MQRLITFGDSFAQYAWPMWPEIMAQAFDETENYGRPGCGNFYIFNSGLTHSLGRAFGHTDTVIVQWTEPKRHDYINYEWVCEGIRSAELITEHGIPEIISDEIVSLRQLSYMVTVAHSLLSTGCKWSFMFLNEHAMVHKKSHYDKLNLIPPLQDRYKAMMAFLEEYKDHFVDEIGMDEYFVKTEMPILECSTTINGKAVKFYDNHPTPRYTVDYLEKYLFPNLGIEEEDAGLIKGFASHAASKMDVLCPNETYNQTRVGTYFERFSELNNYKPIRSIV